jgi:hypothetical protein
MASRRKGISYLQQNEGRLTGLVICRLLKHVIEGNTDGKI